MTESPEVSSGGDDVDGCVDGDWCRPPLAVRGPNISPRPEPEADSEVRVLPSSATINSSEMSVGMIRQGRFKRDSRIEALPFGV